MDRNDEIAYSELDTIERPRSTWNRHWTHKTTLNAGYLVPILYDEDIIPGTTIKHSTSVVCRMQTPLDPIMDNLYVDTYYFKCSKFWYWDHFKEMMGENKLGAWAQAIDYSEPLINNGTKTYGVNDLASYFGIAQGIENLPGWHKQAASCYIDVWNNWFRDQNLQAPIEFDTTDANLNGDGTINTGYGLLPVNKFHDYFTSCLPEPQKGTAISTPLGTTAPIVGNGKPALFKWYNPDGSFAGNSTYIYSDTNDNKILKMSQNPNGFPSTQESPYAGFAQTQGSTGLIADLTQATAATINALRLAFATQRILESDARFGTRYREVLRGHYGVSPSDESINIPEYLGGTRTPINIETVLQNSSTNEESPLGYTGAFSVTQMMNEDFTKSFSKDDILIGLMCIRADHSYQQVMPRQFTRGQRLDRYWPELSHIGNQPVYNYEIFVQGNGQDNEVFGYKEAWQEYLYKNNMITGEMNSTYAQSLDTWHFGDDYDSLPVLSDEWIKEPQNLIDRCLAVQSSTANQFWADIYFEQTVTAPIPLNRVPGLIDHF